MSCGSKEQKETVMVLKVDLDCEQCYKKVKRILCKFPQIRNQAYDKKNNTVNITVLCCSPKKIRDKLCCKAGKSIKSIEIKQQSKSKPPHGPDPENSVAVQEQAPKTKPPDKPQKNGSHKDPKPQVPEAQWVPGYPPGPSPQIMSVSVCCAPCYEGRPGPPCYHTCPPGPPYPCGYCVRSCPPPYYGCRCDCFSEENPAACSVM